MTLQCIISNLPTDFASSSVNPCKVPRTSTGENMPWTAVAVMTTRRSGEHFLPRGSRRSVLPSGSLETRHHVPIYLRSNSGWVSSSEQLSPRTREGAGGGLRHRGQAYRLNTEATVGCTEKSPAFGRG